ncbi:LPO_1073/Vpar_1526 family protein [Streptomyces sp. NPDC048200]|uniref:LPO_1073/Vpar_1526 family protein n=1 Tax=Streptomyces sp. NPDC048200 TaxID=3365512 RepID=UPI003719B194
MRWKTQKQRAGDESLNLQAGRDLVVAGLSYEDTKAVAKDVAMEIFKENATRLVREAHDIAYGRAEEFAEIFFDELIRNHPDALQKMRDPGVQSSIFEAQSSYATTGDAELGDLLVGLLVDRIEKEERDLAHLALNSAIGVAKELRSAHFSLLALNFFVKGVVVPVDSIEKLARAMDDALYRLQDALYVIGDQDLDYLVGKGCLIAANGQFGIAKYLRMNLPGLFTRGFNVQEWPAGRPLLDVPFVMQDPGDPKYRRIDAVTKMDLDVLLESYDRQDLRGVAEEALQQNVIRDHEIEVRLSLEAPRLKRLFSRWRDLSLDHYVNTATGVAIGHCYLKSVAGNKLPPLKSFI